MTFQEKIPRSGNNLILNVPSLTYQGLVLSQIDFETTDWSFEASVKLGNLELFKLSTSYFKFSQSLDLSGYLTKLAEGDKVEIQIKPKQAKKDIQLMVNYTYQESKGAVYYQSSLKLVDQSEWTVGEDLAQGNLPTELQVKGDDNTRLTEVALVPRFLEMTSLTGQRGPDQLVDFEGYQAVVDDQNQATFDFVNDPVLKSILPLLRYCKLVAKTTEESVDSQIHLMARGFKD